MRPFWAGPQRDVRKDHKNIIDGPLCRVAYPLCRCVTS